MNISELVPRPMNKVHFNLAAFKLVPKECGCYILATFTNDILYIGLSENLYDRFKQHLSSSEKTRPTTHGKAVWFYFLTYALKNLEQLERTWLNDYVSREGKRPVLNKVDSPLR